MMGSLFIGPLLCLKPAYHSYDIVLLNHYGSRNHFDKHQIHAPIWAPHTVLITTLTFSSLFSHGLSSSLSGHPHVAAHHYELPVSLWTQHYGGNAHSVQGGRRAQVRGVAVSYSSFEVE